MATKSASIMLLGLLLTIGGTANASLITNGTFDTNLDGWVTEPATTTGNRWVAGTAQVGAPGQNGEAIFSQAFVILAGTTNLWVSFDYQWQIDPPQAPDLFTVELSYATGSGTTTEQLLSQSSTVGAFGSTVSFSDMIALTDLSIASPNGKITFTLFETPNSSGAGTRIQLDNVAVVPEPGTLALLGLGLIGFGLSRKKKNA